MKNIIIIIVMVTVSACTKSNESHLSEVMHKDTALQLSDKNYTKVREVFRFTINHNYDTNSLAILGKYRYRGKKFEETLILYRKTKTEIVYFYRLRNIAFHIERELSGVVMKSSNESIDPDVFDNLEGSSEPVETYTYNESKAGCVINIETLTERTKLYNGLQRPSFAYISFYFNKGSIKDELFYEYLPLDLEGILIRSDIPQNLYNGF